MVIIHLMQNDKEVSKKIKRIRQMQENCRDGDFEDRRGRESDCLEFG